MATSSQASELKPEYLLPTDTSVTIRIMCIERSVAVSLKTYSVCIINDTDDSVNSKIFADDTEIYHRRY